MNNDPNKAEIAAPIKNKKTLQDLIGGDEFRSAVQLVLPKHLTAERFVRVALTATLRTPGLLQCTKESFFNALLSLSQMGLEPDGRRAHLVPFRDNKKNITVCTLIVDYKGLAELVMRSGLVSNIHGDVVCEADVFEYDRGELKKHTIDFRKPRLDAYAVYSLVRFKDGTEKCEVMTVDEVEAVRRRSKAANEGPWVTDWREMAKKTVFKRLSKWLPLTPEVKDAIDADNDGELAETERFKNAKQAGSSFDLPTAFQIDPPADPPSGTATDEAAGRPAAGTAPAESGSTTAPLQAASTATKEAAAAAQIAVAAPLTAPARSIQDDLADEVLKIQGAKFATLHAVAKALGWFSDKQAEDWACFDDISDAVARRLYGARASLAAKLTEAVAKGIV